MNITLRTPDGKTATGEVISVEPKFVTVRVGSDQYFRFKRQTGEPAGSPTETRNPWRIELGGLK